MGSDMGWAIADYYGVSLAPITLFAAAGTTVGQAAAGQPLLAGTLPARKTGAGTVVLDAANVISGSTAIQQGTLRLSHPTALVRSTVAPLASGTLALAAGLQTTVGGLRPAAGGLVDLGNGLLTVATGLARTDLLAALAAARGNGSWTGTSGIGSSTVAADVARGAMRSVGWLEGGAGAVTIAYAAPGDTNLDWHVDILDVATIIGSGRFGSGRAATWAEGDFNFDGLADILDVADIVAADLFNTGAYNGAAAALVAVPEPAQPGIIATLAATAVIAATRRRGRSPRA
jgi:autotransporter-associated beta strand protein